MKTTEQIKALLLEENAKLKESLKREGGVSDSYNCGYLMGRQQLISKLLDFIEPIPF